MKKLNKLFLAAGSVAAVAAPIAAVVSCGTSAGVTSAMGVKVETSKQAEIWMTADGGSVQDKSFNESGLAGVAEFGNSKTKTYNYYEPAKGQLRSGYEQAIRNGAKVVVGTGFAHGDAYDKTGLIPGSAADYFTNATSNEKSIRFIGVDANFTRGNEALKNNLTSIQYNTQYAGYLAGLYAIDYIHKNAVAEGMKQVGGKYHVATYGGAGYSTVTSWMDGFRMAIDGNTSDDVDMVYVDAAPSEKDFSGGFGIDADNMGPQAISISDTLIEKGANVIFPVAGPQIELTMNEIKRQKAAVKVIGVDGDQKLAYNNSPLIIGSAMKHLQSEIVKALTAFYGTDADWARYAGKVVEGEIGFVAGNNSQEWLPQGKDLSSIKNDVEAFITANADVAHGFGKVKTDWTKIVDNSDIKLQ